MVLVWEVARRLLALAGVLLAILATVYYVTDVVQLHPIDVTREQEMLADRAADTRRMMTPLVGLDRLNGVDLYPEARMSREDFLARITKNAKVVHVNGEAWAAFFDGVFQTADRQPPNDAWRVHYEPEGLPDYLFFLRNDSRLQGATAVLTLDEPVMYLVLGDGTAARYLRVTRLRPTDAVGQASSLLVARYRKYAPWLLLVGLFAYILLPWPRRVGTVIAYQRGGGVIVPDWMGIGLIGVFFALALLVVSRDVNFARVMEVYGWGPLTAWSLLAIFVGLPILLFSGSNAVFAIELLSGHFRLLQWGRTREIAYADIVEASIIKVGSPRWLRWFGILMLFVNVLRAAPAVVLLHRTYLYLQLRLRDGRSLRLPYEGLVGGVWLLRDMAESGVTLSDEAQEEINHAPASDVPLQQSRQPRVRLAVPAVCLFLAVATLVVWLRAPGRQLFATLPATPKRLLTSRELQAHHRIVEQMSEARQAVDEAFTRYRAAGSAQRNAAFEAYQQAINRFLELDAQAEALEAQW